MNVNELFEFLGRLYAENILLGKQLEILKSHVCECDQECCKE